MQQTYPEYDKELTTNKSDVEEGTQESNDLGTSLSSYGPFQLQQGGFYG